MDFTTRKIFLIISTCSISTLMSFVIPEDRSSCFPLRYVNRSRKLEIEIFRCWCLDKDRLEKAHSVLWIRIGWYAIDRLQRVKWLLKCHAKKNQWLWITDLQATSRLQLRATMKYRATAILTYVIFNDKKSFLKKGKKNIINNYYLKSII